jgi:hypothetical protein
MSLGLIKMFLKITLCILLGWRLRVFLYFEIVFFYSLLRFVLL